MPAGPFPTKVMHEALKTRVGALESPGPGTAAPQLPEAPWAWQDHFMRTDTLAAGEYTLESNADGTASITPGDAGAATGVLRLNLPAAREGFVRVTLPPALPAVAFGEFLVRFKMLGLGSTYPDITIRFGEFGLETTTGYAFGAAWTADFRDDEWQTWVIRLQSDRATVLTSTGATATANLSPGWYQSVGALNWSLAVNGQADSVDPLSLLIDFASWRPLPNDL